jgi:hypothetical protein
MFILCVRVTGSCLWTSASTDLIDQVRDDFQEVPDSGLEQVAHSLGMLPDEVLLQELVLWVLDELPEADHETPWVWTACLESLEEDGCDLLLDGLLGCLGVNVQDDAREVEGVVVWEPQLIDDGIQEAVPGGVVELIDHLLEGVPVFNARVVLACLVGDEEDHSADDVLVDSSFAVHDYLGLLHLETDLLDELHVSTVSLEVFKIVFQVHEGQEVLIVRKDPWILLDLNQLINLEVLEEGVWLLDVLWMSIQYQVLQLNALFWKVVDKVEMELTQELGVVDHDDIEDAQSGVVEGLECW